LDHNPYGKYEFAGSIFTEDYNTKDFTDPNTVIYGHNMKNGSMFQNLHLFEDKTFMEEHPTFEIYLPDRILTYQVFAAYNYDDRHLMKAFDFTDSEVFRLYLQEILNQRSMSANIDHDVEVTNEDRIVTLSTCNGIDDQRYLVQGVLLSELIVTVN
jgi:sortase B